MNNSSRGLRRCFVAAIYFSLAFLPAMASADNGHDPDSQICICKDKRNFVPGSRVSVYLHYQTFEQLAFPAAFTQAAMENAVRLAIDNFRQLGGMNLDIVYAGLTTNKRETPLDAIVIRAVEAIHGAPNVEGAIALATMGEGSRRSTISISRENAVGMSRPWGMTAEVVNVNSFPGILMHELAHSFGLDHNFAGTNRQTVVGSGDIHTIYGPLIQDIEDLQELYGRARFNVSYREATDNVGTGWFAPRGIAPMVVATGRPVSVIRDNTTRWVMFYIDEWGFPMWIRSHADLNGWEANGRQLSGSLRSQYGISGHGSNNDYMAAWVDEQLRVRVSRTTNGAVSWFDTSPPSGTRSYGTPAVLKLGNAVWLLAYIEVPSSSSRDRTDNGRILWRLSTNNGATWSEAREVAPGYRTVRGVSLAGVSRDNIRLAFSYFHASRTARVVTLDLALDSANNLILRGSRHESGVRAYFAPSLHMTHSRLGGEFVVGYQGFSGEMISRHAPSNTLVWSDRTLVSSSAAQNAAWRVPPTLAGSSGADLYMFTVGEIR